MSKSTRLTAALMLSLLPGFGCDQIVAMITQGAAAAAQETQGGLTGGAKTDDDRLGEKLDGYIGCINDTSRNVADAGQRYTGWIKDLAVGPTGKESNPYTYEVRDVTKCTDAIAKAAELDPDDTELEAAGKAFADAISAAAPLLNEAHKYYDEKNYQDDKWAKGKELHPKIMAAMAAFSAADQPLRAIVAARNDALQERSLARIEADMGKNLLWHQKKIMVLAKTLVELADVQVTPVFELDLAKFEAALTAYEAEIDAANAYAKDHKEETDSVTSYTSFLSDADDYKKTAKEILRRRRDKKEFDKDELERMVTGPANWVEGSPAKLLSEYNDLISTSNSLSYAFYKPAGK